MVNIKNIMKSNTANKTKILSTETVLKSKYFYVDKVAIERGGKTFTKEIIRRIPAVIILPINEFDEIYLVSQFRDSVQEVLLETVAGHIEKGDTPLESAKKELQEETGLTAKNWKQIGTFYVSANMDAVVHIFYATDLTEGEQNLDFDEDIEVVKVPFSEALRKVANGEIHVSNNIAAILLLDKLKREGKA